VWAVGATGPSTALRTGRSPLRLNRILDPVHSSAWRWRGLISPGEPIDVFARAVARDFELGFAQILELDLNGVAAVNRAQAFVISPGGDNVAGIEPEETREPRDLIGNLVSHEFCIIVLPRLAIGPRFYDDVVGVRYLIFGDDPRPAGGMRILTLGDELRAPHHASS
jgi:hypothetical protein